MKQLFEHPQHIFKRFIPLKKQQPKVEFFINEKEEPFIVGPDSVGMYRIGQNGFYWYGGYEIVQRVYRAFNIKL